MTGKTTTEDVERVWSLQYSFLFEEIDFGGGGGGKGCETNLHGLGGGHVGAFLERGNEISGTTKCRIVASA